jgi:putative hydrolase of the HAD superfamily
MGRYDTHMDTAMSPAPPVEWSKIDTVLLDMDGTLLDLRFDNWFWLEHIPYRYAAVNGLSPPDAVELLKSKFHATRGTMRWYCIDHWSRELGLDIAHIKRAALGQVGYLPGALDFLIRLKESGKRRILVTNAHPTTLAIKDQQVGLMAHFDACHSTHVFGAPKEDAAFWPRLQATEPFAAERTLFVDDSLPVLDAAHGFGIGWLRAIRRPDSALPPQNTGPYVGVDRVADLL